MKKSVLSVSLGVMILVAVCSCKERTAYEGYEKNENGLYYRLYLQNEGKTPAIGNIVETTYCCTINDTIAVVPTMSNLFRLEEPLFAGDFFEGLAMMHKGDSASFIVNIDSTFRTFFGRSEIPEEFKSKDVMRFDVRLDGFYTDSEYMAKIAEESWKAVLERINNMKNSYPQETAMAEEEMRNYFAKKHIDAQPTETGLVYVMNSVGDGVKPVDGQIVSVHYTGRLINGKVFDSSVKRGEPIQFPIGAGQVILGWDEGIKLMSKGEKGVLYLPYYLAYGDRAAGENIPAFSNMIFEVELIDIKNNE